MDVAHVPWERHQRRFLGGRCCRPLRLLWKRWCSVPGGASCFPGRAPPSLQEGDPPFPLLAPHRPLCLGRDVASQQCPCRRVALGVQLPMGWGPLQHGPPNASLSLAWPVVPGSAAHVACTRVHPSAAQGAERAEAEPTSSLVRPRCCSQVLEF